MIEDAQTINYDLPPEAFFYALGVDPGLATVGPVDWYWRAAPRATLGALCASRFDHHNTRVAEIIRATLRQRAFDCAIAFNTVPVVAENLAVRRNALSVNGKWLLSGAGGARLRNRYLWHRAGHEEDADALVADHLATLSSDTGSVMTLPEVPVPSDLPFVIEARNLFNYFHFLTETLPRLQIAVDLNHNGPVFIHSGDPAPAGFVTAFIDALFPEIAAQVRFVPSPADHQQAITTLTFDHAYFQMPDRIIPGLDAHAPQNWTWQGRRGGRAAKRTLDLNSFSEDLSRLRARGLALVAHHDTRHLPRRFWIARGDTGPRARPTEGEAELLAALAPFGIEPLRFEDYSPRDQIALMANAELVIGTHGAGFANMIFAGQDTHVIEIGHVQTAAARWSDFIPLAHLAGCHYTAIFADPNWDTPEVEPEFSRDGLIGASLSQDAIATIARLVQGLVGQDELPLAELATTAELLRDVQATTALQDLLDRHGALVEVDPTLLQLYAQTCDALGDPEATFAALSALWRLEPARRSTLERMIWLTRRLCAPEQAKSLVAEHARLFPEQHATFLGKIRWYARMIEDGAL